MSNFAAVINAPRLQDIRLQGVFRDGAGDPLALTGTPLALGDVSPGLAGRVAVTVTDAAAGEFEITIDGSSDGGISVKRHSFRILRQSTDQEATYLIGVTIA